MSELLATTATQTATTTTAVEPTAHKNSQIFMCIKAFEDAQRMVKPLASSTLVPDTFKGKIGDCLIALEMAQRIDASPIQVMQNLYIVHGKPAWSSQFLIACVNASKKFSPLRYRMTGEKGTDSYGCIAWAKDLNDGEILESPEITIGISKKEGWFSKNGSKWQSMPELMLRYRTATLFARLYAPELTMGIQTQDEVIDVAPVVTEARPGKFEAKKESPIIENAEVVQPEKSDMEKLTELIAKKGIPVNAEEVKEFVEQSGELFSYALIEPNIDKIAEQILFKGSK